jgi:hypothetical protein
MSSRILCFEINEISDISEASDNRYILIINILKVFDFHIYLYNILGGWCCLVVVVLLGGKGVRVSTPFIMIPFVGSILTF